MRTRIRLPVIFNARDNVSLWLWTQQGRARSSIRQTRCCGSADGHVITSQTIQTEKAPNVYCWWNAMKFRRLPRGGILQRCATEQQSSVKSHCCLCVRHSESIASPEQNSPPHILIHLCFHSYIYNSAIQTYQNNLFVQSIVLTLCCAVHLGIVMYILFYTPF